MLKNSLLALALVAAGAAAGVYSGSTRDKPESPPAPNRAVTTPAVRAEAATGADTYTTQMYDALAAILEQEVEERQRLEQELEDLQAIVLRLETALQTASTGLSEASARPRQNPRRNGGSRRGEGLQTSGIVSLRTDEHYIHYQNHLPCASWTRPPPPRRWPREPTPRLAEANKGEGSCRMQRRRLTSERRGYIFSFSYPKQSRLSTALAPQGF